MQKNSSVSVILYIIHYIYYRIQAQAYFFQGKKYKLTRTLLVPKEPIGRAGRP